jgi:hypothetical protein
MREFGWTIEYTLSLSYPVFFELINLVRRVRLDAAVDEMFTPYAAAKYGGKCSKALFDGRGSMYIGTEKKHFVHEDITPDMIEKANQRLQKIISDRKKQAVEQIGS